MSFYKINGFTIGASSFSDALEYVWYINKDRHVIINVDGRDLKMCINTKPSSMYLEECILDEVHQRLALAGIEWNMFEVRDEEGNWLSCSEM